MEALSQYKVNSTSDLVAVAGLTERVDLYRVDACRNLDSEQRSEMGQFFTPPSVARFMASLFGDSLREIRLLDAGAGVGTLTAAFVEEVCQRDARPHGISVVAYELEPLLAEYLHSTMVECQEACQACGVEFVGRVLEEDFINAGVEMLRGGLFPVERYSFNRAILNPPYKKIRSDSRHRRLLSSIGIETSNLYSAFLAIVVDLLESGGELVAITPRSFCNGPYFKPFRELFLKAMALCRVHVFESREEAFRADDVLQENVIFHAVKNGERGKILISASHGPAKESMTVREVNYEQVVSSDDPDLIIHIATSEMDQFVLDRIGIFKHSLDDLGISVSTGRVVDFRAKDFLRTDPNEDTVPLVYPAHFYDGFVRWPKPGSKKPNAIVLTSQTESLLLPSGNYVLVKRFSAKEEPRRVVAAIYHLTQILAPFVGFENHLNVYHRQNGGLPIELAKGLAVFLNSTLVDSYFRQFNGHTQVNATDLRMLRYPSREVLEVLGTSVGDAFPSQGEIDELLEREIHRMADIQSPNPVAAKQKIDEALEVLKTLGLPRGQQNERSALTLLALLESKPETPWSEAKDLLMGITPIMDFCRDHYGRQYAPNTRETFRRQTMENLRTHGKAPFDVAVIHGGPGVPGEMAPVARELASDWGVLEPLQTAASLEGQIEELKAVLERNGDLPVTLIGFSWGAWLSFIVAAKYPAIVKKLILIGSGGYEEKYAARVQETRLHRLSEEERTEAKSLIKVLDDPSAEDKSKIFARFGALFSKADAYDPIADESEIIEYQVGVFQSVWKDAAELRRSGKLLELGKHIKCPVVAIHGDYDSHPAEGVQEPLSAILKSFRFVLLRNCGHMPWIERQARDEFYRILKGELRKSESSLLHL